jgi:hypothetical protein
MTARSITTMKSYLILKCPGTRGCTFLWGCPEEARERGPVY